MRVCQHRLSFLYCYTQSFDAVFRCADIVIIVIVIGIVVVMVVLIVGFVYLKTHSRFLSSSVVWAKIKMPILQVYGMS